MLSTKYQKLLLQQLQLMERQTQQLLAAAADAAPSFVVNNTAAAAGEAEGQPKPLWKRSAGAAAAAAEQQQRDERTEGQLRQEAARLHLLNLLLCIQRSRQALLSLRSVTSTLREEQQQLQADSEQLRLWSTKHGDLTFQRDVVAYYYQQVTQASSSTIRHYHQRCVLLNSDVQLLRDRIDQIIYASLLLLTSPPSLAALYRPVAPRLSPYPTPFTPPAAAAGRPTAPPDSRAVAACRRLAASDRSAAAFAAPSFLSSPAAARGEEEIDWLRWLQRFPGMAAASAAVLQHFASDPRLLRMSPPFLSELRLYSVAHVYPAPATGAAAAASSSEAPGTPHPGSSSSRRERESGPLAKTGKKSREETAGVSGWTAAAKAAERTKSRAAGDGEAEDAYDWSRSITALLPVSPAAALPERACVRSIPPGLLLRSSAADLQRIEHQLDGKWGSYKLYESWLADAMRWQWRDAVNMREYCTSREQLVAWRHQLARRMRQAVDLRLKQLWLGRMRGLHAEALQQFRDKIAALLLLPEEVEEADEAKATAAAGKAPQTSVKKSKEKRTQEWEVQQEQQENGEESIIRRSAAATGKATAAVGSKGGRASAGRRSSMLEKKRRGRETATGAERYRAAAADLSCATLQPLRLPAGAALWRAAATTTETGPAAMGDGTEEGEGEIAAAYAVVRLNDCWRSMEEALLAAEDMRGQVLRVTRTTAYAAVAAAAKERQQHERGAGGRQQLLQHQICRVRGLLARLQQQQVQLEVEEDAAQQPEVLEEECTQAEAAATLLQEELLLLQEKRGMRQQQLLDARVSAQAKLLQITSLFDKEQEGLRTVEHDWTAMQQLAKDIEVLLVEQGALRMQELADAAAHAQQQRDAARSRLQEALDQLQSLKMKDGLRKLQSATAKKEEKERKKEKEAAAAALAAAQRARLVAEQEAAAQKRHAEEATRLLQLQLRKNKELEAAAAAAAAHAHRKAKEERSARGRAGTAAEEEKEQEGAAAALRRRDTEEVKEQRQEAREKQQRDGDGEAGLRSWGTLFQWPAAYRRARSTPTFRRSQKVQEGGEPQQQDADRNYEISERRRSQHALPSAATASWPDTSGAGEAADTQEEQQDGRGAGFVESPSRTGSRTQANAEELLRSAGDDAAAGRAAAAAPHTAGAPSPPLPAQGKLVAAAGMVRHKDVGKGEAAAATTETILGGNEEAAASMWRHMETEDRWERWQPVPSFSDTTTSSSAAAAAPATPASRATAAACTASSGATTTAVAPWSPSSFASSTLAVPTFPSDTAAAASTTSASTSYPTCAASPGSAVSSSVAAASSSPTAASSSASRAADSVAASASGRELSRSRSGTQPKARRWLRRPLSALIGKESTVASSSADAAAPAEQSRSTSAATRGVDAAAVGGRDSSAAWKQQQQPAYVTSFSCPSSPPYGDECGQQETAAAAGLPLSSFRATTAAAAQRLQAHAAAAAAREEAAEDEGETAGRRDQGAAAAPWRGRKGEAAAARGTRAAGEDAAVAARDEGSVRVEEEEEVEYASAAARHPRLGELSAEEEEDEGRREDTATDPARYSFAASDSPPSASRYPFLSWHEGISRDGEERDEAERKKLLLLGSTDNLRYKSASRNGLPSCLAAGTSFSPGLALSPSSCPSPAASSSPAAASTPAAPSSPSAHGRKKKGIGGAYGLLLRSISFSPTVRRRNSAGEEGSRQNEPQQQQENPSSRSASSGRMHAPASPSSAAGAAPPLRRPAIFSSREAALKAAALRRAEAEEAAAAAATRAALQGERRTKVTAKEEGRTAAAAGAHLRDAGAEKVEREGRGSEEEEEGGEEEEEEERGQGATPAAAAEPGAAVTAASAAAEGGERKYEEVRALRAAALAAARASNKATLAAGYPGPEHTERTAAGREEESRRGREEQPEVVLPEEEKLADSSSRERPTLQGAGETEAAAAEGSSYGSDSRINSDSSISTREVRQEGPLAGGRRRAHEEAAARDGAADGGEEQGRDTAKAEEVLAEGRAIEEAEGYAKLGGEGRRRKIGGLIRSGGGADARGMHTVEAATATSQELGFVIAVSSADASPRPCTPAATRTATEGAETVEAAAVAAAAASRARGQRFAACSSSATVGREGGGGGAGHTLDKESSNASSAAAAEGLLDSDAAASSTAATPFPAAGQLSSAATAAPPAAASVGYRGPLATETLASIPAEPPLFSNEEDEEETGEGKGTLPLEGVEAEKRPHVRTLKEHRKEESRSSQAVSGEAGIYSTKAEKIAFFENNPVGASTSERRHLADYEQGNVPASPGHNWGVRTAVEEQPGLVRSEREPPLRDRQGSIGEEVLQHEQQHPSFHRYSSNGCSDSSRDDSSHRRRSHDSSAYSSSRGDTSSSAGQGRGKDSHREKEKDEKLGGMSPAPVVWERGAYLCGEAEAGQTGVPGTAEAAGTASAAARNVQEEDLQISRSRTPDFACGGEQEASRYLLVRQRQAATEDGEERDITDEERQPAEAGPAHVFPPFSSRRSYERAPPGLYDENMSFESPAAAVMQRTRLPVAPPSFPSSLPAAGASPRRSRGIAPAPLLSGRASTSFRAAPAVAPARTAGAAAENTGDDSEEEEENGKLFHAAETQQHAPSAAVYAKDRPHAAALPRAIYHKQQQQHQEAVVTTPQLKKSQRLLQQQRHQPRLNSSCS